MGTLAWWSLLLTLLMGAASSPDLLIALFESGMLRLVLQPASLSMGGILFLGLMTILPVYVTHLRLLLLDLPLVTRAILNFLQCPTWMVGSGTQRVAYYTGYPTTVVQASIHLPL